MSPERYLALQARQAALRGVDAPAGLVRVSTEGLRRVNPDSVRAVFNEALGGATDEQAVNRAVNALYATDDFRQVSVRRERVEGRDDIVVEPREKDWGPDYLQFGLNLTTDLVGQSGFTIGSEYRRTWLNRRGLEWRSLVALGDVTGLRSELIQPVDIGRRWLSAVFVDARQRIDDFYVGDDAISSYRARIGRVGIEGRRQFTTDAELSLGYQRSWFDSSTVTGIAIPGLDSSAGEVYARLIVDRLDNWDFPRTGTYVRADASAANDALGADSDYQKATLEIQRAFGRDRHSVSVLLRHGNSFGSDLPPFEAFQLGGFQNLSGYQDRQILASRVTFGRVVYGYQLGPAGALARGLYVGGSIEGADARGRINAIGNESALVSGSLFIAADTAIGPFYLGAGLGEGGERALYLFLGRP